MNPLFLPQSPRRHSGVALVVVLAFVVLLTGVVIAYFSRSMVNRQLSDSSFNQAKSDELARSALEIVTSDMLQEIVNGSTTNPVTPSDTTPTVYLSKDPTYLLPLRNGTPPTPAGGTNPLPTLLRISAPPTALASTDTGLTNYSQFDPAGPGVDHGAFPNALSTTASANGRTVSAARWNQPLLLPTTTDPASDQTPITQFAVPRWVFVNANGPMTPAAAAPTGTIGRYAFAVYDESALLDANVAGLPMAFPTSNPAPAPSPMSTPQAQIAGKKGYLAFADLTQLGFSPAQVSNFVGWRNYASAQPTGTFGNFSFNGTPMDNYLAAVRATPNPAVIPRPTPNNYLKVNGVSYTGGAGAGTDQGFLTRQQLLQYQRSTGGFPATALQSLGTFSRALTAPTWAPSADSSSLSGYPPSGDIFLQNTKVYPYKTDAEKTTTTTLTGSGMPNANRNTATLRWPFAKTDIKHYLDNGTSVTESASASDLYLRHRFSLKRLDWLSHTGVASGISSAAVADCFGLVWGTDGMTGTTSAPRPCWVYNQGIAGTDGAMHIRTLDQVMTLGREPNFFELLKAGILAGSLGKDPGKLVDYSSYSYHDGVAGGYFELQSVSSDMQLLKIGADIIDQWDSDSYPTAIYFPGAVPLMSDSTPETNMANMAYGVENLPYIYSVYSLAWYTLRSQAPPYLTIGPDNDVNPGRMDAWLQPQLWNPFQVQNTATNPNAANDVPTDFCVRAYGNMKFRWTGPGYSAPNGSGGTNYGPAANGTGDIERYDTYPDGESNEANVFFTDSNTPSAPSSFVNPSLLTTTTGKKYNTTLGAKRDTNPINVAPNNSGDGGRFSDSTLANSANVFLGIHAGWANYGWTEDPTKAGTPTWKVYHSNNGQYTNYSVAPYPDYQPTNGSGSVSNTNPPGGVTVCLQYYDPISQRYLPYAHLSRYVGFMTVNDSVRGYGYDPTKPLLDYLYGTWQPRVPFAHSDALTDRFSCVFTDDSHGPVYTPWIWLGTGTANRSWAYDPYWHMDPPTSNSPDPCAGAGAHMGYARPTSGFKFWENGNSAVDDPRWASGMFLGSWAQNNLEVSYGGTAGTGGSSVASYAAYSDPDGVVRAGNDYLWNPADNHSGSLNGKTVGFANFDGISQAAGGYSLTSGAGTSPTTTVGRRPLILNRPFQSVAELGYAYRDDPFRSLDMFSPFSADSALLELYCLSDEPTLVAGRVNINNAPISVIQAIIGGANKQELDPSYIINNYYKGALTNEATLVATNIAKTLAPPASGSGTTPVVITNRADLPTKLMDHKKGIPSAFVNSADMSNKTFVEAPIRALSDVTNTRTWNLMIDVIAQSGQLVPNATTVNQFAVQGESRYWLHVAIDRFTGKIVDQQLEQVSE